MIIFSMVSAGRSQYGKTFSVVWRQEEGPRSLDPPTPQAWKQTLYKAALEGYRIIYFTHKATGLLLQILNVIFWLGMNGPVKLKYKRMA